MSARYGLLGEKLGHSLLPQIHRELGGYEYALMEVGREDLPAFFATRDFQAVNVAMPYMEAVLPWMDSLSETAAKTGCVNTVVKDSEGALHGYNTEYYGFTRMVRRSRVVVSGRKCLVLGRSGVSDTVRTVLEDLGLGKEYFQVFKQKWGFVEDLSIMDLLFNEGPSSIIYLKKLL